MPSIFEFTNPISINFNSFRLGKINNKKPLFSNNSLVFYKQATIASGGIGTVKNYRKKSFRT